MQGSTDQSSFDDVANTSPLESEESIALRMAYFEYLEWMLDHQRNNREYYLH
jgi:hypothetical protein